MAAALPDVTIPVSASCRATMERRLDEAVCVALSQAMLERSRGILVTRHRHDFFTVALSESVPFGLTLEHRDW
jgi:hypothetical protein